MLQRNSTVVYALLATGLTVISLTPVFAATYFPSQNGPWYLLAGHMLTNLSDPAYDYSQHYTTNLHAIPHLLHTITVAAFATIAPALWAQKLAISVYVIGLPVSIFYFLGAVAPNRRWVGFFGFLMIHTYCFYRGYHNYSLSIPLYFLTLGQWLRSLHRPSGGRYVVTLVLVSLTYLAHLFTFGILAASMGWYLLCTTRRFWHSTLTAVRFTWPGWLMMLEFMWLNSQINTWVDTNERVWLPPHSSVEYFFRKYFYTTSVPVYIVGSVAGTALLILFVASLVQAIRTDRPWWNALMSRPWMSLTLILTAFYFALPWKFLNWHYVNVRIIPFVLGAAMATVATSSTFVDRRAVRRAFVTACTVGTLLIAVLMAGEVRAMNVLLDQYTAGIPYLERNSRLLPINLDNPQVGQVRPLTRAHEYYHIARGGVNGSGAAVYNTLVPVRYREYPDDDTLPKYHPDLDHSELTNVISRYDAVLIWGGDNTIDEALTALGCELTFRNDKLRLYACPETAAPNRLPRRRSRHTR